jgi:hypothetical protein
MTEAPASEKEVESLLAISGYFDPAVGIQLMERAKRELDLERIVLDQQDVSGRRGGCPWGGWPAGRQGSHRV